MSGHLLGVVAHVDRESQYRRLAQELESEVTSVDDGTLGVTGNHAFVLDTLVQEGGDDGWVVVLEDDAVPIRDLRGTLDLILGDAPSPIVSLYLGTGYPQNWQLRAANAIARDTCWITAEPMLHAVGYALGPGVSPFISAEMGRQARAPRPLAPDETITRWVQQHGEFVSYTNPSLVDHEDRVSVIRTRLHGGRPTFGRNRVRKAHNFGTRLTWNDTTTTM